MSLPLFVATGEWFGFFYWKTEMTNIATDTGTENCIMGDVKTVEVSTGDLQYLCVAVVSADNPSMNTIEIFRHDCAVK